MPSIALKNSFITLAQALKVAAMTASGGEAKNLIKDGAIVVNDAVEVRPGRKLRAGDRFRMASDTVHKDWLISPAE